MTDPRVRELQRWMTEHTPRLLAVVRGYAFGPVEAEDLLQEVWLRAYEAAPARPAGRPVLGWLVLIAVNLGRDYARRQKRRARLRHVWQWTVPGRVDPAPVRDLHPASRLWRALASLPALQRAVVVHRLLDELSTTQTAVLLQRSESTIKTSLARALDRLRQELSVTGEAPSTARRVSRTRESPCTIGED